MYWTDLSAVANERYLIIGREYARNYVSGGYTLYRIERVASSAKTVLTELGTNMYREEAEALAEQDRHDQ